MRIRISYLITIISIIAAVITIFVFFTGKLSIFDFIDGNNISNKESAKNKPNQDSPLVQKLKKYRINTLLVYQPELIVKKQIDETIWNRTKDKIEAATNMVKSSKRSLESMLLDKLFFENKNEYVQQLEIIEMSKVYSNQSSAKIDATSINADAVFSTKITMYIIAQSNVANSALKALGTILGAEAEKINIFVDVELGLYHASTGALLYKDTDRQQIIGDRGQTLKSEL